MGQPLLERLKNDISQNFDFFITCRFLRVLESQRITAKSEKSRKYHQFSNEFLKTRFYFLNFEKNMHSFALKIFLVTVQDQISLYIQWFWVKPILWNNIRSKLLGRHKKWAILGSFFDYFASTMNMVSQCEKSIFLPKKHQ